MASRVIFHIDMNAFYASVAQIHDPSLKNKPVGICKNSSSAILTTCSYEARKYGVSSAMPLVQALKLCPNLVVVEPDFELYRHYSEKFINYLKEYTPLVEILSIDECLVDMTEVIIKFKKPLDLAYKIQHDLYRQFGLPCSIGVAPNRFLAKMASDLKKPLGITVLRKREIKQKLWPLPIEDFYGIGKVTQSKLKEIGIHTIGDLANFESVDVLESILHNQTFTILEKANGIDSAEIDPKISIKSISASNSLVKGIGEYQQVSDYLWEQTQDIVAKLKKHGLYGLTLSVSVGMNNEKPTSKSKRNEGGYQTQDDIFQQALYLFDEFESSDNITFLSLSLNNLKQTEEDEIFNLFNYQNSQNTVDDIIKNLNKVFDKKLFRKASESND